MGFTSVEMGLEKNEFKVYNANLSFVYSSLIYCTTDKEEFKIMCTPQCES